MMVEVNLSIITLGTYNANCYILPESGFFKKDVYAQFDEPA